MKIGIASLADIDSFLPYFEEENARVIISKYNIPNSAPAVNTLILSFLEAGHSISLFTMADIDFEISGNGINIYGIKNFNEYPTKYLWGDFINARNVQKVISRHIDTIDVLHAHWTYWYAYAASAFVDKLPVFCTVRDWTEFIWKMESFKNKVTWSFRYLMNELVFQKKGIHFIANSSYTATCILRKYNLKVPIIPNPIKESFITDKGYTYPENLEILCISSSNDQRKNVKTLLLAFQHIVAKYPDAHLTLIGSPFVKEDKIIERWRREGLLRNVSLPGSVSHDCLKTFFDKCRLFVTPSLEETFGNTLLESMARKVPIVAGKYSGAIPHILEDGEAGFLCDVSSVSCLAETILYTYAHPQEGIKKAAKGYSLLKRYYNDIHIANTHISLYNKYAN